MAKTPHKKPSAKPPLLGRAAPVPASPANVRDIPVPEPGTLALIAVGAVVFGVRWKRRAA